MNPQLAMLHQLPAVLDESRLPHRPQDLSKAFICLLAANIGLLPDRFKIMWTCTERTN